MEERKMDVITTPFSRVLFGFSGIIHHQTAWESGKPLMDKLWGVVRENRIETKGLNHWFYESPDRLFVGVEPLGEFGLQHGLERKIISIPKYATAKHLGGYGQLGKTYQDMMARIQSKKMETSSTSLEIYGHDRGPDSTPEVEILIGLL
jgi:hypothetical protein